MNVDSVEKFISFSLLLPFQSWGPLPPQSSESYATAFPKVSFSQRSC